MEIFTRDFIKMINPVALDNITGKIKAFLRAILTMVSGVGKAYGRETQGTPINSKANTKMIKNGVTVSLHGQTVIFSREIILVISETAMAKCIGYRETITREIGKTVFNMERVFIF